MNYFQIYDELVRRAKSRNKIPGEYYELHHIIPKCMGGTDDKTNLVSLSPEEHYLAHQLLVKMYPNNSGLVNAAVMMTVHSTSNHHRVGNKMYGWLRRKYSEVMSIRQTGMSNHQYGTCWITDGKISKKIKLNDPIPSGWYRGRVLHQTRKNVVKLCRVCHDPINTKKGTLCAQHLREAKSEIGKRHYKNIKDVYKNKIFITDGKNDKLHLEHLPIPDGWTRGRSNNRHLNKK